MGAAQRREDVLYARLGAFKRKLARARALIAEALSMADSWYVGCSGGKDSLVVLALVAEQRPGVAVKWDQDELDHDEQVTYIPALCERVGARLCAITCAYTHADWFACWSEQPYWREPLGTAERSREPSHVLFPRRGYRGVFLGLRQQEAPRRRVYLRSRGRLHQDMTGLWRCNPIAGWTVADVWAAIATLDLDYNPVYDRLAEIGVPREQQRVGPLPLSPGWILRDGWPSLYRRLVIRYGMRWAG